MKNFKVSQEWLLIFALALFKLMLHFLTSTNYELQRDAYLYLAQGDHPAFGFLSVPPLIAVTADITRFLFGDSVFAVRLFPAIVGAASVVIIGMIVRNLGGKIWAILLACSAFVFSPAFLRSNSLFQPVTFNQFFWLLSAYFILKLLQSKNTKFWLHLNVVWGIGFLNKYSIAFLIVAFWLSLLVTSDRRLFFSKYFAIGSIIDFLIILPNLIWQLDHNFPLLTHMRELQETQLIHVSILSFIIMQFMMNLPGLFIWLVGLLFFLFLKQGKDYRVLGYTYLFLLLLLILLRGKAYYTLGIYSVLFAAGGYALEIMLTGRLRVIKPVLLTLVILLSLPIIPYSLPVLPYDKMAKYAEKSKKYGGSEILRWEDGRVHRIPQDYADMTGWKELSDIVIHTYNNLDESEKSNCAIYAENYGEAGAVKYYGKKYHIPEPISFSDSFLLWAPDSSNIQLLIYVNDDTTDISYYFADIKKMGEITDEYARENGMPIYLCRNPRNGFNEFYEKLVRNMKDRFR